MRKLKEQNLQLKEENNLLQYKIEILLDMVCEVCYIRVALLIDKNQAKAYIGKVVSLSPR